MSGFGDKEYRATKKRVEAAIKRWHNTLGLRWWRVEYCWYNSLPAGEHARGGAVMATCEADWRYLRATVKFAVESIWDAEMDDDELESLVVHEMAHILVNEMRDEGLNHEERVVETIAKALLWARAAG